MTLFKGDKDQLDIIAIVTLLIFVQQKLWENTQHRLQNYSPEI